ncbi:hypothetical protein OIU74_023046, partial [Salix koriyanagi]
MSPQENLIVPINRTKRI